MTNPIKETFEEIVGLIQLYNYGHLSFNTMHELVVYAYDDLYREISNIDYELDDAMDQMLDLINDAVNDLDECVEEGIQHELEGFELCADIEHELRNADAWTDPDQINSVTFINGKQIFHAIAGIPRLYSNNTIYRTDSAIIQRLVAGEWVTLGEMCSPEELRNGQCIHINYNEIFTILLEPIEQQQPARIEFPIDHNYQFISAAPAA